MPPASPHEPAPSLPGAPAPRRDSPASRPRAWFLAFLDGLLAEKLRQASHSELVRYRVLVAAALFQSTVASLYLVTTPVSLASVPSVFVLMGYVGTLVLARRGTSPQAPALLLCIAPEHQWRVFTQGFTTKKMGHGFGLHSSALAANEMGGQLSCSSPGPGLGATFTLALPLRPAKPAGLE